MATRTANGVVSYSAKIFSWTLDEWIQKAHKTNCDANGWTYCALHPGSYGYDSLAMSLFETLSDPSLTELVKAEDIDALAKRIHDGWRKNYTFWTEMKPYIQDKKYIEPYSPLNDARRNACAESEYEHLNDEEKAKDVLFASFVIELCSKMI